MMKPKRTKNSFYLILKVANNERKINNVIELDSLDKVKVIDARLTTSASNKKLRTTPCIINC